MDERKELIELLKSGGVRNFPFVAVLADYLIKNGVTVRQSLSIKVTGGEIKMDDLYLDTPALRTDFLVNGQAVHHTILMSPTALQELGYERVKHGRWIVKQTALGTKYTVCSNCGYGISIPLDGHLSKLDLSNVPRCPNCGARMDLPEQAEEAYRGDQ